MELVSTKYVSNDVSFKALISRRDNPGIVIYKAHTFQATHLSGTLTIVSFIASHNCCAVLLHFSFNERACAGPYLFSQLAEGRRNFFQFQGNVFFKISLP